MMRALNESSSDCDSGDGSDGSQVQLTREAQEQQLYGLYESALQDLKDQKESTAKETLIHLLTLIRDLRPDIHCDQLRFLACKNLGQITAGDVAYFLDALQIDASDAGLWIKTGIRAFDDVKDYQLARLCFEAAHKVSPNNWIAIDRLLECDFVLHDLFAVVELASKSLQRDRTYAKAAILLKEACTLNPVWKEHVPAAVFSDSNCLLSRPEVATLYTRTIDRMRNLKLKRRQKQFSDSAANQAKRSKIALSLDNMDLKVVGHKILKLFDQMERDGVSLSRPLDVVKESGETPFNSNGSADDNSQENRRKGRFPIEFMDKRRSSRVQRLSKGLTNEQTVIQGLLQLIPDQTKGRLTQELPEEEEEVMKSDHQSVEEVERDIVKAFVDRVKRDATILDLMQDYLVQVSQRSHQITVPLLFTKMYDSFRRCRPLPQSLAIRLGQDVTVSDVYTILTANEVNFRVSEEVFLSRLLPQLEDLLPPEQFTNLFVRVYFMRGVKGKERECLQDILSLLTHNKTSVEAANHVTISIAYVKSLIGTRCASDLTSLMEEGKFVEVINSLVLKPLDEVSAVEEDMLFQAILKSRSWERGVHILNKRDKLDERSVRLLLQCLERGQRVSLKLATLLSRVAVESTSIKAWCCLYWVFLGDTSRDNEEDDDKIMSFLSLGHQFLGKKGICTGNDGEFLLLSLEYMLNHSSHKSMDECVQECFCCLFRFPPKKAPAHGSRIQMTWDHANTIYGYFMPDCLPEYDSNKTDSIDSDMEQLLLEILKLVPPQFKPEHQSLSKFLHHGSHECFPRPETNAVTSTLYYLLADYYFKNKEFRKAKYFYMCDLGMNPDRFDSWAGMSLTRSHQLEQQLSKGDNLTKEEAEKFFLMSEATFRSFERALTIDPSNAKLVIEFGNVRYNVTSQVSRMRKAAQRKSQLDVPALKGKQKELMNKAKECFESASRFDLEDEQWLPCYMQGKIMESHNILKALHFYEVADLHLQQAGASYPRRIAYHTPPYLAIEALEVHYRSFAAVLKYLSRNPLINRRILARIKIFLLKATHSAFVTQSQDEVAVSETLSDLVDSVVDRLTAKSESLKRDIIGLCVSGIGRCLSRFPEHYKSMYRLAYHYYTTGDVHLAQQILLTGGADVRGLFSDRKPNNLFNGIWRIPIDEIDRPGSFSSHMQRSAYLLIRVSAVVGDFHCLCSIATQLSKVPEAGKKYLREGDRLSLAREAFDTCTGIMRQYHSNCRDRDQGLSDTMFKVCEKFIRNNVFAEEANRLMADFFK